MKFCFIVLELKEKKTLLKKFLYKRREALSKKLAVLKFCKYLNRLMVR